MTRGKSKRARDRYRITYLLGVHVPRSTHYKHAEGKKKSPTSKSGRLVTRLIKVHLERHIRMPVISRPKQPWEGIGRVCLALASRIQRMQHSVCNSK